MGKTWALDRIERNCTRTRTKPWTRTFYLENPSKPSCAVRTIPPSIATDRRVFVFKKGVFSGAAMAKKLVSWDYRNVTGVQVETGAIGGTFTIQAAGAVSADAGYWSGGKDSAFKSTNAVALTREHFDQAKAGAARTPRTGRRVPRFRRVPRRS